MFNFIKSKKTKNRIAEETLYEQVLQEIGRGIRRDGLWAKAISESLGDINLAKAIYIKLRVQSLQDEMETKRNSEKNRRVINFSDTKAAFDYECKTLSHNSENGNQLACIIQSIQNIDNITAQITLLIPSFSGGLEKTLRVSTGTIDSLLLIKGNMILISDVESLSSGKKDFLDKESIISKIKPSYDTLLGWQKET